MKKPSDTAKKLAKTAYPEYKGRKISVTAASTYFMSDYWSEGSRNYAKAINLATGEVLLPGEACHMPYNGDAHAKLTIPPGVAIVEHSIFCGKDCGITIYINPTEQIQGTMTALLLTA